jgi:hypothetical protein
MPKPKRWLVVELVVLALLAVVVLWFLFVKPQMRVWTDRRSLQGTWVANGVILAIEDDKVTLQNFMDSALARRMDFKLHPGLFRGRMQMLYRSMPVGTTVASYDIDDDWLTLTFEKIGPGWEEGLFDTGPGFMKIDKGTCLKFQRLK